MQPVTYELIGDLLKLLHHIEESCYNDVKFKYDYVPEDKWPDYRHVDRKTVKFEFCYEKFITRIEIHLEEYNKDILSGILEIIHCFNLSKESFDIEVGPDWYEEIPYLSLKEDILEKISTSLYEYASLYTKEDKINYIKELRKNK